MVHRTKRRVLDIPTDAIRPNPMQPRQVFQEAALRDLAASIRQNGILQPLTVRRTAAGWELVAGERRLRAAKLAGLTHVPCLETAADDQRSALLGRSPSAVANKLRLLRLSPACREVLTKSGLTERHARCLLRLEDESARLEAVRYITDHQLNVAQTEQYVDRLLEDIQSAPPAKRRTFILKDVRLFLNSVDRGLRLIREAGVDAQTKRDETEDAILLTIRIPKQKRPGA